MENAILSADHDVEVDAKSPRSYLTFILADEVYGVDVLRVEEIRGSTTTTRIPNAPDYLIGVENLRGAIVPILDLRKRFGLDERRIDADVVVVVLRAESATASRVMGVVVDAVADVLDTYQTEVGVTPEFGSGINTEFITGLASSGENMIMLLDVDKLLNHPHITDANDVAEN